MAIPAPACQWKCDSNATKIVIPAWVTSLTWASLEGATAVEEITFEPGSQLRELELYALNACESLKSICIPAFVEVICYCFAADEDWPFAPTGLERITFEQGSRLREIRKWSFCMCDFLRSMCLPASVELLDGSAFRFCGLRELAVESGNRFFRASGPFLLDCEGIRIVWYFGRGNEVALANEIEIVGSYSFASCSISAVKFGALPKLSAIEREAFAFCRNLESITIPSSVTILCHASFTGCSSLHLVSFETGSRLVRIDEHAFSNCLALKSIVFPPKLEIIGESCFFRCENLEVVVFSNDSSLIRIERVAFENCRSLKSFSLPSLVEFVGENCFDHSPLSTLTFSSPSHLRELLDVPGLWTGVQEIPDSVEALRLCQCFDKRDSCALTFGRESRLADVSTSAYHIRSRLASFSQSSGATCRFFVQASTRSVKLFRSKLEFGEAK
jgi:hypothetical protein